MSGRRWTPEEDTRIAAWYRKVPVRDLAASLDRSERAVYMRAIQLGVSGSRVDRTAARDRQLRALHAKGWSDPEIAEQLGADRSTIGQWRRALGLPSNAHNARHRAKTAAATRRQCRRMGVKNMAECRQRVWADAIRATGWPEDLRIRHVQILDALYRLGPMTRRELAEAIGMPWQGTRRSLKSSDPEGSYLAHLMKRGLVVNLGRIRRAKGRGRGVCVYSVPLHVQPNPQPDQETTS